MNYSQENRLSMYYAVKDALNTHNLVWSVTVAFAAAVAEFLTNIGTLESVVAKQVIDIRGFAKSKAKAEDTLVEAAMKVAGGTLAFATVVENAVLATQMKVSDSGLRSFRDGIIAQACQGIHDSANAEILNLADYGILPADMTALQAAIDAYVALVSAPRNAIASRKGHTTELAMMMKDTSKLLDDRMDAMLVLFAETNPEFHREYFDARIIVDLKGGATKEDEGDIAEAA